MHEDDRTGHPPGATAAARPTPGLPLDPGAQPTPGPRPTPGPSPSAAGTRDALTSHAGDADGDPRAATGDDAVDQALSRLDELDALPVREHVAVFDAVHAALQDRLADVED